MRVRVLFLTGSRGDVTILPTLVINNKQYRGMCSLTGKNTTNISFEITNELIITVASQVSLTKEQFLKHFVLVFEKLLSQPFA
jgi:hypothetical protein